MPAPTRAGTHDMERYRVARLQRALDSLDVVHAGHRLPVDGQNYVLLHQADVFSEGIRIHALDQQPAFGVQVHRGPLTLSERVQLDAELVLPDLVRFHRFHLGLWFTQLREFRPVLKYLGAVQHRDIEVHVLAVAIHGDGDRRIHWSLRHARHQVLAILYRLGVHRDDNVIRLQSRFIGWSAPLYFADQHSRAGAQGLEQLGFVIRLGPFDSNGPARDFAGSNNVVINPRHHIDGQ